MTEYWKSIPKYWCKYCKTFVRDTPLEKNNHEATPRHQGNLKRSLRDLHRDNERSEREQQRAKDEVARLNGLKPSSVAGRKGPTILSSGSNRNATSDERKRQMAQLAELGIAVPEDFRRENAMAGDWETVSQRAIYSDAKPEVKDEEEVKPGLGSGVQKREAEGEDDEEDERRWDEGRKRRRKWGTDVKALPGSDDDLDALLGATKTIRPRIERDLGTFQSSNPESAVKSEPGNDVDVKGENPDENVTVSEVGIAANDKPLVKEGGEDKDPDLGSIFKKRKPKSIRPR